MAAPSSSIGNSVHFERLSNASFATSAPPLSLSRASSSEDSASLTSRAPLPSTLFRKVLEHLPIEDWAIIANTCDLYSSYPSQESHLLKSSSAAAGTLSLEDLSNDDFPIDESDSQFLATRTLYENFLEIPQFSRILPKLPARLLREKGVEEAFSAVGGAIENISALFNIPKESLSFERKVLLAVAYSYSIFCTKVYDTLKNAGRDPADPGLGSPQNPENPFRAFKNLSLHEIIDREDEVIEASILWLENEENKNLFKYVFCLELKGMGLFFVPEQIRYFVHLIAADFSDNWILHLPDAICELRHLASLDVSSSHMLLLPKEIGDLKELQYLFLQKQHLLGLPTSLYKLKKLQVLNLSENYMRGLFCAGNWKTLKSLFLRDNQLTAFPEDIEQLENLEVLDLSQNRIGEIPDSIASLSQLRALILSENKIGEISPLLGDLENLESLSLDNNQVRILPEELQNLVNLKKVYLHQNRIQRIPTWVKYWESLETITLKENPICRIPDVLLRLKNLQDFFVSRVPALDAFQVSGLKKLEISGVPLEKIPGFSEKLKSVSSLNLEVLNLENCNLRNFPKSVLKVDSLVFLSLSKNAIREIPEEIVLLENLQNLQLAENRLRTLPEELFSLRKLQLLDLSGNYLTRVSKRIAQLSSLDTLDLSRNRIVDFPRRVWFLPKLVKLHLEYNCIRSFQGSDVPFKSYTINKLEFGSREIVVQIQGNPIKKITEQLIQHSSTLLFSFGRANEGERVKGILERGWAATVLSAQPPLLIVGLSKEMAEVYSAIEKVASLQARVFDAQQFAHGIKHYCSLLLTRVSGAEANKFVRRVRVFTTTIKDVSEEGARLRALLNERGAWPRLAKIRKISGQLDASIKSIGSALAGAKRAFSDLIDADVSRF